MPDPNDPIEAALAAVIQGAASPAVQEAQALLLRRLALEGSVLPSRLPAPANITEMGGYLNLLAASGLDELRTSAIATVLGLASPAAVAWDESPATVGFASVGNPTALRSRFPGIPIGVAMRADLAAAWDAAVRPRLAQLGAELALWAPPLRLPDAAAASAAPGGVPEDALPALGRMVYVAPELALGDPDTDPVLLGRADTDPPLPLRIVLRCGAASGIAAAGFNALVWDMLAGTTLVRPLGPTRFVALDSVVRAAGFAAVGAPPVPASRFDVRWTRLVAVGGLVPGVSTLGDELRTVWTSREIARSAFATRLKDVWNGAAFVAAP
jgi:hypothetical protein